MEILAHEVGIWYGARLAISPKHLYIHLYDRQFENCVSWGTCDADIKALRAESETTDYDLVAVKTVKKT